MAAGVSSRFAPPSYEKPKALTEVCGEILIGNPEYLTRNNHSSIHAAKDIIRNSCICSADHLI